MLYFTTTYFLVINITGFFIMIIDKKRAQKGKWRIAEKKIWLIAFIGGSLGIMLAMKKYRHKTKHHTFVYGIPACFCINAILYLLLLFNL